MISICLICCSDVVQVVHSFLLYKFNNFPFVFLSKLLNSRSHFDGFCSAWLKISFKCFVCRRSSTAPFDFLGG